MKVEPPYFCQTDQQNVLLVRNKTENSGDLNAVIRSFNKKRKLIMKVLTEAQGWVRTPTYVKTHFFQQNCII